MTTSYLLEDQVREIVAFDMKRRAGGNKPTRKTLRYNYIIRESARERGEFPEPLDGRGDVIVLHVAVRLNAYYQPVVKDVNAFYTRTGESWARDLSYRQVAGWCVAWQHKDIYGLKEKRHEEYLVGTGVWARCPGAWKYGSGGNFPYHETINPEALKGTRFEYCQYADNGIGKTGLIDWLMLYREEPKVELLAKMGFYALISPMGLKALKDKAVFDWVRTNADEIRKASKNYWGPREIVYAAKHGVTLKAARWHFEFAREVARHRNSLDFAVLDEYTKKTGENCMPKSKRIRFDYALLEKRVARWHIEVAEYARYLEYAIRSGLDWKNEGTLYPPTKGGRKAFMERLEALEAEAEKRRRKREREERRKQRIAEAEKRKRMEALFAERAVEIEAFQKSLERSKTLSGCGYKIVLAKSQKELLAEGKKMHNCVGMGHYGEGIVKGDRLIVILKDASGKSYCDIEIERKNWTVKQCYLKRNAQAPEELHALAKAIAQYLKKEFAKKTKRRKAA